jgi:hypothetical protein
VALLVLASVVVARSMRPVSHAAGTPTPTTLTPTVIASPPIDSRAPSKRTRLVVHTDSDRARVQLDDRQVIAAGSRAELELEPDRSHALVVTAPGRVPWRQSVVVKPGATLELSVRLDRHARAPAAVGDDVVDPYEDHR